MILDAYDNWDLSIEDIHPGVLFMATLTVMIHEKPGRIYRIDQIVKIGRDSINDIQILDQKVSRRHLTIEKIKGFFIVKDLGSRNGIYLNDVRVNQSELKTGDTLRIGGTEIVFSENPLDDVHADDDTKDKKVNPDIEQNLITISYEHKSLLDLLSIQEKTTTELTLTLAEMIKFSCGLRPTEYGSLILQELQDMIHCLFSVDRSFIILKKNNSNVISIEAVRSVSEKGITPDFNHSQFTKVLQGGYSLLSFCGFSDCYGEPPDKIFEHAVNAMCVPIRMGIQILGMIYIDVKCVDNAFSEKNLILLSALGTIAGSAISTWISCKNLRIKTISSMLTLTHLVKNQTEDGILEKAKRRVAMASLISDNLGLPDDQHELITEAAIISSFMDNFNSDRAITETLPEGWSATTESLADQYLGDIQQLQGMHEVVRILRFRNENFDGSGVSSELSGNSIPLGSRVLKALSTLDEISDDISLFSQTLKNLSGTVLDPMIVRILNQVVYNGGKEKSIWKVDSQQSNIKDSTMNPKTEEKKI